MPSAYISKYKKMELLLKLQVIITIMNTIFKILNNTNVSKLCICESGFTKPWSTPIHKFKA